jgi:hypothetical protein
MSSDASATDGGGGQSYFEGIGKFLDAAVISATHRSTKFAASWPPELTATTTGCPTNTSATSIRPTAMIALTLSRESPFTAGRAADGSGSDELGFGPFSPAPPPPGTPLSRPSITPDLDNLSMITYPYARTHAFITYPGHCVAGFWGPPQSLKIKNS